MGPTAKSGASDVCKVGNYYFSSDVKNIGLSRFLAAAALFFGLSVLCGITRAGARNPVDFPYRSWSAWAIEDYLRSDNPQLVFLGSSLMLSPLGACDACYLNIPLDASQHHRSAYIEAKLKKSLGISVKTFNFALPGEMPSDAYLITRLLLKEEKRPCAIVYGVGPRDFMDSMLPSPAATDPYQWLSRLEMFEDVITRFVPEFWQQVSYQCERFCYLYRIRSSLSLSTERLNEQVISHLVPRTQSTLDIWSRRSLLPNYRPYEIVKGECQFRPALHGRKANFNDNLEEYRKRYGGKVEWELFLGQLGFFVDTVSLAQKRGIRVIMVIMPITDLNKKLLGEFKWNLYRQHIKVVAKLKGATLVDFGDSECFSNNDFMDTVHLNAEGGRKLLDLLAVDVAKIVSKRSATMSFDDLHYPLRQGDNRL